MDYVLTTCLHLSPTVGNNTAYSLRNASDYKYIHTNTQLYYNSFLPSVVRDWNELLLEMHQVLALLNTVLILP